ncbi:MAG: T9SS type A sorting domain-containing protein [Bacteroidota bacterium]|nr:T9SS type A sorting domain-containing protein [Bacteroidota bacterium]
MKNVLFVAALLLLCSLKINAVCLNGIYTIGGASPDFTTITAAVNSVVANGVCGPVTFNIRNGTYLERLNIISIPGSSPLNTITFQSELLDSSLVTISETSTSTLNYIVRLNGADNIIFRKLSITNNAPGTTAYQSTFVMTNDADNITIENCSLYCLPNPTSSQVNTSTALIFSGYPLGSVGDSITIRNNRLTGNNYAIVLYLFSPPYSVLNTISDNYISGQYNSGIRVGYASGVSVLRNSITESAPSPFAYTAIAAYTVDTAIIANNNISCYGVGITYSGYTNAAFATISNNSILSSSPTNQSAGINVDNGTCNIYHNTIRVSNITSMPYSIYMNTGLVHADVRNNIMQSLGPAGTPGVIYLNHLLLSAYSGDGNVLDCRNNGLVLWRQGSVFHYYSNLTAWNIASSQDHTSSEALAQFVSTTDSHIASDFSQNATSGVVGGITTDIENNARSFTAPYPGAYEHPRVIGDDADARQIRINNIICSGTQTVNVVVKNRGTSPLTSCVINWNLNNILQTPFIWTGNIPAMDTALIPAGTFSSVNNTRYIIRAWTSSPNNTSDVFVPNDSTISDTTWSSLAGSYTVGGTAPDFTTITQAIITLKTFGVCGPVTLLLRNGTYVEQVIIDSIPGASTANPLRITSQSGDSTQVIWQYTSTNSNDQYTLKVSGALWLNIDHITLKQLSTTFVCPLWIDNKSHDVNFNSVIFNSPSSFNSSSNGTIVYSPNTREYNIRFSNSSFTGGYFGINFIASSVFLLEKGIEINNCYFYNQNGGAISMLYSSSVFVIGNHCTTTTSGEPAISIGVADTALVSYNIIDGAYYKGINLVSINQVNSQLLVYNNAVNLRTSSTSPVGIDINNCPGIIVEFNTVRITAPNATAFKINGGVNGRVRNNIFQITGTNGTAFNINTPIPPGFIEDYNDLWASTGTKFILGSTTYTSLPAWRTATGFSLNSISLNPLFLLPNDCHVNEIALRNAAVYNPAVPTDMDGDIRSNPADIGADETNFQYVDASAVRIVVPSPLCPTTLSVPVVIRNAGTIQLTQLTINWTVNAISQPPLNWTGSLNSGDSVQVNLGTVNFNPAGPYLIRAITSMPNSTTDSYPANDTATYSIVGTSLSGSYTVGGTTPDFATPVAAVAALNTRGVCGPVTFLIRNGTYSGQLVLNAVNGASVTNRIRFVSQSGDSSLVIISSSTTSAANYVINLSSASFVTFSKLSVLASNNSYGSVFGISGNCQRDSLYHCVLTAPVASTTAKVFYESGAGNKTNFDLSGNRLQNGINGIYLNVSSFDSNFVFKRNIIQCLANGSNYIYAIGGVTFSENTVLAGGLYFSSILSSLTVQKNQITGQLQFQFCNITPNQLIINNVVTSTNGNALYIINCAWLRILNNTFRTTGTGQTISISGSTSHLQFINNIVDNNPGDALWAPSFIVFDTCDYNNWRTTSNIFAYVNSVGYPTFAAWRTASGLDQNSFNLNPQFISSTDFHLVVTSPLLQQALPLSSVPDDIDGDLRGTTMDIGADENPLSGNEAALNGISSGPCHSSTTPVSVNLTNNGGLNLMSITINWTVNQVIQTPVTWTGNILPAQTLNNVVVGTYPFAIGQHDTLKIWISNPNSQIDPNPNNDTISTIIIPRYNGIYTVGGASPDFVNPVAAFLALHNYGVCGPVILNVRDGIYTDTLNVRPIPGSSAFNTVTLTAESGDSSAVILQSLLLPNNAGALASITSNTANIIFLKLTLRSGVCLNTLLLNIGSQTNNITVSNCVFRGVHGVPQQANIYGMLYNRLGTNITIKNNLFIDGEIGANLDEVSGLYLLNNTFYQQWNQGFAAGAIDKLRVIDNKVEDAGANPAYIGIGTGIDYINSTAADSAIISGNQVTIHNGTIGINIESNTLLPAFVMIVANNAVSVTSSSAASTGLKIISDRTRVVFNTVRMLGTDCDAAILAQMRNGTIKNNCFANYTSSGTAFNYMPVNYNQTDYNNYYSASSVLGTFNSAPIANLSALQSASTQDINSNSGNPNLFNTPFWRPGSAVLENSGIPVIGYGLIDIDGQPRSSSTPDMGVDEFTLGNDIGIYSINSAALTCTGTHTVTISLRNFGATTASTATLHWNVNGIPQPNVSWTGSLLPGDSIPLVTVGTFSSAAGSADVLVYIQYSTDVNALNDSIHNNRNAGALSGIYTIGGMYPDFRMLNDAFTAIETNGVCGPVTLSIRNGFYFEMSTLTNAALTSANNLTIISESGDSSLVTLWFMDFTSSINNKVLGIDSTNYVYIRSIGINNGTTSFSSNANGIPGIRIIHGSDIHVSHCKLVSNDATPSQASFVNYATDNSTIDSNLIVSNFNAMYLQGAPALSQNTILKSNTIHGNILIESQKNILIENNMVENMLIENSGDSIAITRNRCSEEFIMYQLQGTVVHRNMIWNNFFTNTVKAENIYYTDFLFNNIAYTQYVSNQNAAFMLISSTNSSIQNNNITCTVFPNAGVVNFGQQSNVTNTIDYNNYWNSPQTALIAAQQAIGHDQHSITIDPQYFSATDLHVQNPVLGGAALPIPWITDDIDGDLRPASFPTIGADDLMATPPYQSLVWPGNANKDTIVDNNDLLQIGLYLGQSGYTRQSISNSWFGFPCFNWVVMQNNTRDMKFVDSDGDGVVTLSDTVAIGLNYGLVDLSPARISHQHQTTRTATPLYFVTSASTYNPGDWIDVVVWAGTSISPVVDLYGSAFKFNFTTGIVNPGTSSLSYPASWLCTSGTDGINLQKVFESQGHADGALTRYDFTTRTGFGPIAKFTFQADSSITVPTDMVFDFTDFQFVDSAGNSIGLIALSDTITILPMITAVPLIQSTLITGVFPNPATEEINVSIYLSEAVEIEIEIQDMLGQIILIKNQETVSTGDQNVKVNISNLAEGIYILSVRTSYGTQSRRIVISR